MFTPGEKHWTTAAPRFRRRPGSSGRPLLAAGLGLVGALTAVGLTGVGLPIGLAGVSGLLTALLGSLLMLLRGLLLRLLLTALLGSLLLRLLLTALLGSLLLRLLLTALLGSLLLLLGSLLLAASERIVGGCQAGIRLGQPGLTLRGVARGDVTVERSVDLLQFGDHALLLLPLFPLLSLLRELLVLAGQDNRPQVGERFRMAGLEAQVLLGPLHGLRIGDGHCVGLADLNQDGGLNEKSSDLRAIHTLTLQALLAECGVQLLDHDVDVLLTDNHGVAGPVHAGVVHIGHLTGVVGAAGECPDGEEECSAGGEDACACGKASGHGLLLEGDDAGGRHGVTTFLSLTLPFHPRRRTQPVQPAPPGHHSHPRP